MLQNSHPNDQAGSIAGPRENLKPLTETSWVARLAVPIMIGLSATAVGALLRMTLWPVAGSAYVFAPFFGAVVVAAWVGGALAGISTMISSSLVVEFAFLSPRGSFAVRSPQDVYGIVAFFIVSSGILVVTSRMRSAEEEAKGLAAEAQQRLAELHHESIERTAAEQRLLASERRYRLIADNARDLISLVDSKGRFTYASPSYEAVLGYSARDLYQMGPGDLAHEEDRPALEHVGAQVLEYRLRKKDGTTIWVEGSRFPIEVDGETLVVGIARDISRRKEDEARLRESEEQWRFAMEQLPHIVWTALPDGSVDYYNSRLEEFTGIPSNDGQGAGWHLLIHPEDLEPTAKAWKRAVETGEYYEMEHRIRRGDGEYRWALSRAGAYRNEQGEVVKWYGTATDITDMKLVQESMGRLNEDLERRVDQRTQELQRAYTELEGFCYSVSHDLRTPMRAISAHSGMLIEDYSAKLDDDGKKGLQALSESAVRMGDLIDDLLQFSRLGRRGMQLQNVDLSALARDVAGVLAASQPEIAWEVDVQPGIKACCDPLLLRMVLENLFENACKYRKAGQPVQLRLESPSPNTYCVRDRGIGFDMAYAERIFLPFERLHRAEEFPGNGIGLANVRRIVERHGGRVWAEGELGQGAVFFFTLPQA